jgi:hypothetical protein
VKLAARGWLGAYALVIAAFLAAVATYYHPGYGFTAFIEFPKSTHGDELPAVQAAPHYDHEHSGGYDGQFYAQFAVEPLLRDPAIDRAMDSAPYRAHRILFSWTAYVLGLGKTAWILQAYAIQNVVAWLLMAWLLCRWMPPRSARLFVLWAGCLLSHGLLVSVRYALVDGPSVLLLSLAVVAAELNRPWLTALTIGISGVGRETNLIATPLLTRFLRRPVRSWLTVAAAFIVALLPFALWLDYLRSVYRSRVFVGGDHIVAPFTGFARKVSAVASEFHHGRVQALEVGTALCLLALVVQSAYVIAALMRSRGRAPWALVAAPFVVLAITLHPVVWEGYPGAFTRVLLPIAIGANVLLAQQDRPAWWLIVLVNLDVVAGVMMFVPVW